MNADKILEIHGVRFVGLVNRMGRLVSSKYRKGVTPRLNDMEEKMAYMGFALEMFLREDFDDKLGPIEHVFAKRKNINILCVPIKDHVVVVSMEPDTDTDQVIKRTSDLK